MGSSASTDLPLGTVIRDTYEIVGVLGRGGMGTVFMANHLRLPGRQVAIKVLRNDGGLGAEVAIRFRREAEIASRLGHPNIVEVLDFDSLEDGSPFLVMECLRGQPLSRRLRKGGPLTLEEVFSIARQMGSALQAAHRAGIVHRDLKPGNVFLVPTEVGGVVMEHVKLLDFGISKIIDSQSVHTAGGILLGTPQYMAPEQAQGKNQEVDPRTDIFSFGCMVYEMLARRLPFKDGPLPELIYRIVYDPPQPLASLAPDAPPDVVEAVERALRKRPEDRYPDVGAFIEALTGSPLHSVPSEADVPLLPALAVPTANPKPPSPEEQPPSQPPTVDGRRPARASAEQGASSKRPAVNVPLHDVSTLTVGTPPPEGAPPEVVRLSTDAPTPMLPTQVLRSKAGGGQGPAPSLEKGRSRKRWVMAAAVLVLVGAVGLAVGLRPVATVGTPVAPVARGQGAAPRSEVALSQPPEKDPVPPGAAPSQAAQGGTAVAQPSLDGTAPSQGTAVARSARGDAAPSADESAGTVVAQAPPAAPGKARTSGTSEARSTRKDAAAPISEEALADLMAAEKALARGDTEEALHLTRRSQRVQVTGTSFSLLTRTHCRQRDLSNARTAWERVPAWERTRVRSYCKQYDIEL